MPLSKATPAALQNRAEILTSYSISPVLPPVTEEAPDPPVKVHVDFMEEESHTKYRTKMMNTVGRPGAFYYNIGDEEWKNFKCKHRHDESVCKCHLPVYHVGQDEAIFKQYALPSRCWRVNEKVKLRPKSEGQGVMVSAIVDEWRGFGFTMTPEEVELVNRTRQERADANGVESRPKLPIGDSPGLIFFQYGNARGKEGYWDCVKFQEQCVDFMDAIEILYPDMQILLEVDHSSGHLLEQSDGLMVKAMGLRWGGKTVPKRDSMIEEGCLGDNPPIINGRQLTVGMLQKMVFQPGDPKPFNDPKAKPNDVPMNEAQAARELEIRRKRAKRAAPGDGTAYGVHHQELDAPCIIEGYVGKNKGILQVSSLLHCKIRALHNLRHNICQIRSCMKEDSMWRGCKENNQRPLRRNSS